MSKRKLNNVVSVGVIYDKIDTRSSGEKVMATKVHVRFNNYVDAYNFRQLFCNELRGMAFFYPSHPCTDHSSGECQYYVELDLGNPAIYREKRADSILDFLSTHFILPSEFTVLSYDPRIDPWGFSCHGTLPFSDQGLVKSNLKELLTLIQIRKENLMERLSIICGSTVSVIPILPEQFIINCINEAAAKNLRLELFRLVNEAGKFDLLGFNTVKDDEGTIQNNKFLLKFLPGLSLRMLLDFNQEATATLTDVTGVSPIVGSAEPIGTFFSGPKAPREYKPSLVVLQKLKENHFWADTSEEALESLFTLG